MSILIFLVSFIAVFILATLLLLQFRPFFREALVTYKRWQERRKEKLSGQLEESFIFVERKKQLFFSLSPLAFAILGFIVTEHLIGILVGFLLGLSFPAFFVKFARLQRIRKFQQQLIDGLMILNSSLKGGLSLIQAMEVLAEEMPPPISQEFSLVLKSQRLGVPLEDALNELKKRVHLSEVNLIISSILVARETGGELTRVFSRLIDTIRSNLKLKDRMRTLTLQGRLQGIIMAFLPIVFTIFIYKQNPGHFDVMFETEIGRVLIAVAVLGQILGMYLIKRISTIKI